MKYASSKSATLFLVAISLVLASCATGGTGQHSSRRGSADRITSEELQESVGLDLYTIVQRLRPQWLRVHGVQSTQGPSAIAVILDGQIQQAGMEMLRNMRGSDVQELRYMNPRDATTRFGTNMTGGAIEIITKR